MENENEKKENFITGRSSNLFAKAMTRKLPDNILDDSLWPKPRKVTVKDVNLWKKEAEARQRDLDLEQSRELLNQVKQASPKEEEK